jgi:NTE family protein
MPGTALVLSGGGAMGAFQVGAEKYLREEQGFSWDVIAGVSVGSLNGAMLSMGKYARLEEIWSTSSNSIVYTGKLNLWALLRMVFGAKGALSNEPLKKLIETEWDPSQVRVPVIVGVVSMRTGGYRMFAPADGDFPRAVLASTTMPVYWEPIKGGADFDDMVDGGLRNISPLGAVLDADPDRVVIINCEPKEPDRHPQAFPNALKLFERTMEILLSEIIHTDIEEFLRINRNVQEAAKAGFTLHHESGRTYKYFEAIVVQPPASLGDVVDFSASESKRRMEIGRQAAMAAVG